MRKVGAGVPFSVRVGLEKYGSRCIFQSVSGNSEGGGEVREMKDWLGEEKLFQGVEGRLTGRRPIPG